VALLWTANRHGSLYRPLPRSTTGLRIEGNTLNLRTNSNCVPDLMRQAGLRELLPVVEVNCQRQDF